MATVPRFADSTEAQVLGRSQLTLAYSGIRPWMPKCVLGVWILFIYLYLSSKVKEMLQKLRDLLNCECSVPALAQKSICWPLP